MSTAVATTEKRGPGQPTKLTPRLHKALVTAVKKGSPLNLAAQYVGIPTSTLHDWLKRGRGDHPSRTQVEPYVSFAEDIDKARPSLKISALTTLNRTVKGQRCKVCSGTGERELTDKDGSPLLIRCPPCGGTGWQIKPDGKLALTVLERQVGEFARLDRVKVEHDHRHDHQHTVSGTVTIEHTTTSAAASIVGLGAAQIAAMMGSPMPIGADVIEAEVVEVEAE